MALRRSSANTLLLAIDSSLVGRLLDAVTRTHLLACGVLMVLALACFAPGLAGIPAVDSDEARFVQATKQMLETGDYVDIRLQEEPRYKKPVGIYWLQAAAVRLTGHDSTAPIWAYRLVSVAGALAAILLTYWAALPLFGRRAAFIAAAILATSAILVVEAHLAKTDAVLLATVVLAQGALARLYLWHAPGRPAPLGLALLFWAAIGVGFLIKGPIIVMVAGLTIVTLLGIERQAGWLRRLRPLLGVPLALAIILPWLLAILSLAGQTFLDESVGTDLLGKLFAGQEDHGAPPGTHFAAFWLIFWPGAFLAALAAAWAWAQRDEPAVRFCLAWLVPTFLVFEAVTTKLPHYTLPTYPAIALLIGGALATGAVRRRAIWARIIAALPGVAPIIAGALILTFMMQLEGYIPAAAVILVVVAGILGLAATWEGLAGRPMSTLALLLAAAVPFYGAVFGLVAPQLNTIWLSPRIAAAVEAAAPCPSPEVAAVGMTEASLVFAVGTGTRLLPARKAAEFMAEGGCRIAVVAGENEPVFLSALAAAGKTADKVTIVSGIAIGRVRHVDMAIYRSAAGEAPQP